MITGQTIYMYFSYTYVFSEYGYNLSIYITI